jgi:protein-tyrosine phosphatase
VRLRRAIAVIEGQRRAGQGVWVCCALGFSRSAGSVIGWLGLHGPHGPSAELGTLADAQEAVRRARPQIVLRPAWLAVLDQLSAQRRTPHE